MGLNDELLKGIGESVRNIRTDQNLTQEDLALKIDRHREFISRIERGMADVRVCSLLSIAHALNVEVIEIIPRINRLDFSAEEC